MNKGDNYLKKLWFSVSGEYQKEIWFYELS